MNDNAKDDRELLTVILGNAEAADSVLKEIDSISNVGRIGGDRLRKLNRVTEQGACRFEAFVELHRRLVTRVRVNGMKMNCSSDIYEMLKGNIRFLDEERFIVVALNTKNQLIEMWTVSIGGLDGCHIEPREVFKRAIFHNVSRIVLVHNHPSGDPTPSSDDMRLTTRLQKAGEVLGISVLDHLVIGDNSYSSFRDLGIMTGENIYKE